MASDSIQAPASAAWQHTVALIDRLFPPSRRFAVRLWDGTTLPGVAPAFTLVLNHPGALRRMLRPPAERSLGEAYIAGDFEIEGDLFAAVALFDSLAAQRISLRDLIRAAHDFRALPKSGTARTAGFGAARGHDAEHARIGNCGTIQHDNLSNDFYALWLDHRMQFSCGYFFTRTEDLEMAQEYKLDYICHKLHLQPGERLLDIGCGWGGLAMYAAEHYGVRVLGITLSEQEAHYANTQIARAGLGARASVKVCDERGLGADTFDKIVSVSMFEHVGVRHLPEYFAHAYRLLKPDGLFLSHSVACRPPLALMRTGSVAACCAPRHASREAGWQRWLRHWLLGEGQSAQRCLFPNSKLAPLSSVNLIAERTGFEVRDMENLREQYALTLRQWVNRLEAHRAEVVAVSNEATYRTWQLYRATLAYSFEIGSSTVNQTLLSKPAGGNTFLPLTRVDRQIS